MTTLPLRPKENGCKTGDTLDVDFEGKQVNHAPHMGIRIVEVTHPGPGGQVQQYGNDRKDKWPRRRA